MSTGDWCSVIGLICAGVSGAWFVIMQGVKNEIAKLKEEMQEGRINRLIAELDEERRKNEYLKDSIKNLK